MGIRLRRPPKSITRPILAALAILGAFAAWVFLAWDNFGTVRPGEIYRVSQVEAGHLTGLLQVHKIRTVLNLRGSHPESAWYRAERAAALQAGATQVDIPLSSCEWMSRAQARALLEVLEAAERPILIHCFHGSERTGMVAAFAELLRDGSTLADAEAQFTARHLYFGLGDGVITRRHLERYEGWLRDQHQAHSPNRFRRWLESEYRPDVPNREQWEFDPYPLVVVTRPSGRVETSKRPESSERR